jgi:ubiquinone/menaquinone biosynthesis C-methylase UbiE
VYAVDVQSLMIQAIVRRMQREGLTNVTPVLGDYDDPSLPANANPDAVLIVDTFHEAEHPVVLLQNVARTLKAQGRIGIIDYREGEGGPGPGSEERVPPGVVISQAQTAGLKLVEQHKFSAVSVFPHLRP